MTDKPFLVTLPTNEPKFLTREHKGFRNIFSLLTGNRAGTFFQDYWEKRPVHFQKHNEVDNVIHEGVFSRNKLMEIIESEDLPLDTNLTAVQYIKKLRKSWDFELDVATAKEVTSAFKNSYTVQFFQPQRFSDDLHTINSGFEHEFGSLAGASAYLTPANSQGLAPHHDDVDVFVLQCEGSKVWNLWENGMTLPEQHSNDIPRSQLVGPGTQVVLQAGDMMYLPRGTIHEALAQSKFSTHVTISVYQQHNVKKLLINLMPRLLDSAFSKNYELRKGLPLWMSEKLGSFVDLEERQMDSVGDLESAEGLPPKSSGRSKWRLSLVEQLKSLVASLSSELCLAMVDEAADEITGDFVMHRLPPPEVFGEGSEECDLHVDASSLIKICDPRGMFCMVKELSGVSMLAMAHNKRNERCTHMGHPDHSNCFSESDSGNGDEEDGESNDDEGEEEDGEPGSKFQWALYLPIRLAPIILTLKERCSDWTANSTFCSVGVTLRDLQVCLTGNNIFTDELIATINELRGAGFVQVENARKPMKKSANPSNRSTSRNCQTVSVLRTSSSRRKNETVEESTTSKSEEKKENKSVRKKMFSSLSEEQPMKKHTKISSESDSGQTGFIVCGANRFYESDKKSKKTRKKLRS